MNTKASYEKGISAIIPTYKGEKYIHKLLDSLKNQTLNYNLFEAIFILNGELDSTPKILEEFKKNNPKINIIITKSDIGVCNARNHGINMVKKEYVVFIDDDDFISPKYFEKLYEYANPNRIVIGTFFDIDQDTGEVKESYLTPPLLKKSGIIDNPFNYMRDILVITTDKLIPTENIRKFKFNPDLKNGVDISFYSQLYVENDFEFYLIDKKEEAIYYRLWRDNSISRQKISYEFNVTSRLKVINDINKALKKGKKKSFLESLTAGQVVKINEYLEKFPEDLEKVSKEINSYDFEFFPYKYFDEDLNLLDKKNNELIVSYSFPPTNTTTGNVVAKRILSNKRNVDVICGSLFNEKKDCEFEKIVNQFIINKITIDLPFSTDWNNISKFVEKGIDKLESFPEYEKVYSRSHFPHSHFLALEYKLNHEDTFWSAEFSDPTIYNFEGCENSSSINDKEYVNKINKYLSDDLNKIKETDSINFISEYLTFIFADELIFTNENQKEVMSEYLPYNIRDIINKKSKIIVQPTLDKKYYYMKESSYNIDDSYVNFAYFGVIFGNRTLEDFINGFDNIDKIFKDKFKLHVFSPNKTMFEQILSPELFKNTVLNENVSFLEFLNLTTKFDVLLVNDSQTTNFFKLNPFLPSKLSDYLGSEKDIWGICQENSPMDSLDISYKSRLGELLSIKNTLNNIMLNKLDLKKYDLNNKDFLKVSEPIFKKSYEKDLSKSYEDLDLLVKEDEKIIKYLRNRSLHFSKKIAELIEVAETEFEKNRICEEKIKQLKENLKLVEKENIKIKNSNSWKITKSFRKIGKKFK